MELSLGETETLVARATRGFGLSWGLAQEAGRAASILAGYGFPAVKLFADLFRLSAASGYEQRRPVVCGAAWSARGPALCPIILGSAISDRRRDLIFPGAAPVLTDALYCPLIVVAMLVPSLSEHDAALHFQWGQASLWLADDQLLSQQPAALTEQALVSQFRMASEPLDSKAMTGVQPLAAGHIRSLADRDAYDALAALARLTYVPAGSEHDPIDNRIQAD